MMTIIVSSKGQTGNDRPRGPGWGTVPCSGKEGRGTFLARADITMNDFLLVTEPLGLWGLVFSEMTGAVNVTTWRSVVSPDTDACAPSCPAL
jgi:hypothetical protein